VGIQMGFHIEGEIREYELENEKKGRKFERKRKDNEKKKFYGLDKSKRGNNKGKKLR
jgi:hypothetical protein